MPNSRSVFSFRNSQGKLGVHNPLTPGKYAVYFTFSSTRKTWLNSALSLVNRTFYQTVNVRKISRSWLVFPLRKRQGQLGIHHHLTEGKYAVHVTLSSTWKTGLNSWFSLVNQKFYRGKPKKVRVSGSSIKLTGIRKQANGWGVNALQGSETWHFEKGIKQQSLVDTHWCTLNLNWSDTKNARFDGFFFFFGVLLF